jgi:hypothetical protein
MCQDEGLRLDGQHDRCKLMAPSGFSLRTLDASLPPSSPSPPIQVGCTLLGCLVFHLPLFSLETTLHRARLTAFLLGSIPQSLPD